MVDSARQRRLSRKEDRLCCMDVDCVDEKDKCRACFGRLGQVCSTIIIHSGGWCTLRVGKEGVPPFVCCNDEIGHGRVCDVACMQQLLLHKLIYRDMSDADWIKIILRCWRYIFWSTISICFVFGCIMDDANTNNRLISD